jgi:hypothetical protein
VPLILALAGLALLYLAIVAKQVPVLDRVILLASLAGVLYLLASIQETQTHVIRGDGKGLDSKPYPVTQSRPIQSQRYGYRLALRASGNSLASKEKEGQG